MVQLGPLRGDPWPLCPMRNSYHLPRPIGRGIRPGVSSTKSGPFSSGDRRQDSSARPLPCGLVGYWSSSPRLDHVAVQPPVSRVAHLPRRPTVSVTGSASRSSSFHLVRTFSSSFHLERSSKPPLKPTYSNG